MRFDNAKLALMDHWAYVGVRVHSVSDAQFLRFLRTCCGESVIEAAMHIAAFQRQAGLASVHERSPHSGARSNVDVGIIDHDLWVLAATLKNNRTQAIRGPRD